MKKVLLILSIVLLTACGKTEIPGYTDTVKFKEEYEALNNKSIVVNVDEDVDITYLTTIETIDLLENKSGVIYFGFPTCPWCRNILPVLIDVIKTNNSKLYYFDPSGLRGTDDEDFNKIMTILNEYLDVNESGEKTLYVPDVYFIKEGNIVGHHLGSVESQSNPYEALTESQKQELKDIYINLLGKVKE